MSAVKNQLLAVTINKPAQILSIQTLAQLHVLAPAAQNLVQMELMFATHLAEAMTVSKGHVGTPLF